MPMTESYVICYPNAGLPNALGGYDEAPVRTAKLVAEFARDGLINIVGGCCGTTPDHIKAIYDHVSIIAPRKRPTNLFANALNLCGTLLHQFSRVHD